MSFAIGRNDPNPFWRLQYAVAYLRKYPEKDLAQVAKRFGVVEYGVQYGLRNGKVQSFEEIEDDEYAEEEARHQEEYGDNSIISTKRAAVTRDRSAEPDAKRARGEQDRPANPPHHLHLASSTQAQTRSLHGPNYLRSTAPSPSSRETDIARPCEYRRVAVASPPRHPNIARDSMDAIRKYGELPRSKFGKDPRTQQELLMLIIHAVLGQYRHDIAVHFDKTTNHKLNDATLKDRGSDGITFSWHGMHKAICGDHILVKEHGKLLAPDQETLIRWLFGEENQEVSDVRVRGAG